ncbi:MAG: YitT family protein [Chitinophagaceae bacterium]|nr:YitT family protein [Chitinophagaceae bacterium]
MNTVWKQIILQTVLRNKREAIGNAKHSNYELAKALKQLRRSIKRTSTNIFLIAIGVLSAGFGLKSFLLPNGFIDGGAVGISLLISKKTVIPLSILLFLVNVPFIIMGFKTIGKDFAIKTTLGIAALSLVVAFFPYPQITHDKLLVAIFGGFFLGTGIGLAVRGGGVIDGTEVLAVNLSKRLGITIGDVILIMNVIIFSAAAYLLTIETALYSMLTYLSASKTVDFIIEGIEEYTGVTIISHKSDEIKKMISENIGHGLTIYKGEKGFGKTGKHSENTIDIIYTILTRLEVSKLNSEIEKIDPHAFIIMNSIKDTKGGMIKKKRTIIH